MDDLILRDGLWWPPLDTQCWQACTQEVGSAMSWLRHNNDRWGTIIQAGGNCGVWPRALSGMFDTVMTFEPDKRNYAALKRNTAHLPNVLTFFGALGDKPGMAKVIEADRGNCGAHRVEYEDFSGAGSPMWCIDGLRTQPDVIWLDVEGYELQALMGARQTLAHRPLLILEMKSLGKLYGHSDDDIRAFLATIGYMFKGREANDELWEAK